MATTDRHRTQNEKKYILKAKKWKNQDYNKTKSPLNVAGK